MKWTSKRFRLHTDPLETPKLYYPTEVIHTHPMDAMTKWAVSWVTKKPIIVMTMPNSKVQTLVMTILPVTIARYNCMFKTKCKIKWFNIYSWTVDKHSYHFCTCNLTIDWITRDNCKGITSAGRPAQNTNNAEEASQSTTLGIRRRESEAQPILNGFKFMVECEEIPLRCYCVVLIYLNQTQDHRHGTSQISNGMHADNERGP